MHERAPRNRTISCSQEDIARLSRKVLRVDAPVSGTDVQGRLVAGDIFEVAPCLPREIADLLILDPPYNLTKSYGGDSFRKRSAGRYADWFQSVLSVLRPILKPNATVYVCSEWRTSAIIQPILESEFEVRNRITWEREKGRGARANWKSNAEDVWFCTMSSDYCFDVDAVKLKRRVLAPYKDSGIPKDWRQEPSGKYRLTYPSNIWTDLTVPFWSMPENTDHPTQKPEKLIAKLVLASSLEGGFVFDPFVGSGTTAVVAQKLNRRWCGIDLNVQYLCWALRRLELAERDSTIQGYADGVFWERNTGMEQRKASLGTPSLFK